MSEDTGETNLTERLGRPPWHIVHVSDYILATSDLRTDAATRKNEQKRNATQEEFSKPLSRLGIPPSLPIAFGDT